MSTEDDDLIIYDLPEGGQVATGLNLATVEETLLLQDLPMYPDGMILDPKDIERLLPTGLYLERRKLWVEWMIHQWKLGKCNASAAQALVEMLRQEMGYAHRVLCDNQLYWRINGGRDAGSALVRGMQAMLSGGISGRTIKLANGHSYTIPVDVYRERDLPAGVAAAAAADAKRNVAHEFYKVPKDWDTFKRVMASAVARRQPIVWAWHVVNASMRLNGDYMICGGGPGNHANVFHAAKWVGGEELVHLDNRNSWGPSKNPLYGPTNQGGWGQNGYGLCTMRDAFRCINNHDFYVGVAVTPDSAVNPLI